MFGPEEDQTEWKGENFRAGPTLGPTLGPEAQR